MIAPARQAAFDALLAHDVQGLALPAAIARARAGLSDVRDHALLTELAAGVVRMRLALDYQIGLRLTRRLASLDPVVRIALRLGAFQLLYLDRLPPSAVVNDAVALTRRAGRTSAGGLVNAVLRRLVRERHALGWPEAPLATALSVQYSHPEWLVVRWLDRWGEADTRRWLAFNNAPPRLCLAVNTIRVTREELRVRLEMEGVRTEPTARSARGLHVVAGPVLASQAFRDGLALVQDEASQLIADLGIIEPGRRVLDLCASPGGKTAELAARVGPGGLVVACDVRPRRVRLLRQTLARLRLTRVPVVHVPAEGVLPFRDAAFDVVVVDAPCSGLGTLRRDPDIRWSCQPGDLPRLAAAQRALLARAAPLVAGGGTLVYATCSSEPDENEDVVAAFLAETPSFALVQTHRTTPAEHALEAFYGAVLTRVVP